MTRLQIVHLLDDFALGGVTKGLDVYNDPGFTDVAESRTVAIKSDAVIAPRVDADIIEIPSYLPKKIIECESFYTNLLRNMLS